MIREQWTISYEMTIIFFATLVIQNYLKEKVNVEVNKLLRQCVNNRSIKRGDV